MRMLRRLISPFRLAAKALRDERGGEVLEYVIIAGLIVLAALSTITCVGGKVAGRWTSVNSKL
jgi:Flp pilus assembly pilin Flp